MKKRLAIEWLILVRCWVVVTLGTAVSVAMVDPGDWGEIGLSTVVGLLGAPLLYLVVGAIRLTLAASRVAYFSDEEAQ